MWNHFAAALTFATMALVGMVWYTNTPFIGVFLVLLALVGAACWQQERDLATEPPGEPESIGLPSWQPRGALAWQSMAMARMKADWPTAPLSIQAAYPYLSKRQTKSLVAPWGNLAPWVVAPMLFLSALTWRTNGHESLALFLGAAGLILIEGWWAQQRRRRWTLAERKQVTEFLNQRPHCKPLFAYWAKRGVVDPQQAMARIAAVNL